ncbi:hypothetical protein EVAR_6046_1 [Eumeta japonica]|uniref:Uncharacterized protein n=1 Tax=Eumeta variegata TaxID=151549 RepID=A0A4C1TAR2_EUMVA|nr:hypothetical protein EVAR_6046_1 [Eumeta japonica]
MENARPPNRGYLAINVHRFIYIRACSSIARKTASHMGTFEMRLCVLLFEPNHEKSAGFNQMAGDAGAVVLSDCFARSGPLSAPPLEARTGRAEFVLS